MKNKNLLKRSFKLENSILKIYTDGACKNNDVLSDIRRGGYCAIILFNNEKIIVSGKGYNTTNNRMELTALIEGLKKVNEINYDDKIKIYLDSNYVKNAFTENWIVKWQNNNWKSGKKEIKNRDLWEELIELTKNKNIEFIHVQGHSGNKYNEEADKIALRESYN